MKHALQERPIGLLGFKGAVGNGIATLLRSRGHRVLVDVKGQAAKRAEQLGCEVVTRRELLAMCPLLIGASTTGPLLHGKEVSQPKVLVDLALPPTLEAKTRPKGFIVYAGEPLLVPGRIRANFWGRLWLLFARYGRGCVYACFAEPILGAVLEKTFCNTNRRLSLDQIVEAGEGLTALCFKPVLQHR